jgi:hypothetical protein
MLPATGAAGNVTVRAPAVVSIGYPTPALAGLTLDVCTVVQLTVLGIPDVDAVVIAVPVDAGSVIVFVPAVAGTVNVMAPEVSPAKMSEDMFYFLILICLLLVVLYML